MNVLDAKFARGFLDMAQHCSDMGWHERNGGNMSYRIPGEEIEVVHGELNFTAPWINLGADVSGVAGEFFMVTGTGKFFMNTKSQPETATGIVEISEDGEKYRTVWGLTDGGLPTSELPSHLLNHMVKKEVTNGAHRVIYHSHPTSVVSLTFILELDDRTFSRELWATMTECPSIFPAGIGVLPWMVPGSVEIGRASSEKMREFDVLVWTHHGMFCSGPDFDMTFGLTDTVDKAAKILINVLSMGGRKRTMSDYHFKKLEHDLGITMNHRFIDD